MTDLGLPRAARPEELGFSSARLDLISATFRRDVEEGRIPGAVCFIARAGRLAYAEAFGWRDREEGARMESDAIFPIASMTKPLTSVAAMILAEEGRLHLAAPVAEYLPGLAGRTVGIERVPAPRAMSVQDLLRHTSGFTYAPFGDSPVHKLWREADLMAEGQTNAELVEKLASLPLLFEPGTTWEYGMSTDVLGRVVEVVSGKSLGEFFLSRITEPLGMTDTGFAASGERAARLARPQADPATGVRPPMREFARGPVWESGGGGLASTAGDYLRFCRMLLAGGEFEGARILSPASVALMSADHLPPSVAYGATTRERFGALAPMAETGYGFGLGFAVRIAAGRCPLPGSLGDYFWGGVYGTYFWIDPVEKLIAILMLLAPEKRLHYRYLMRELVYAAILGPVPE
jgi:CubicO group peptidase (beta-lactamase class C family)